MPLADGVIFLAPHPGQGRLLLACIDPSVADEQDPMSVVPQLDPFSPANGFAEPPASSAYTEEFLGRYRAAQRDRVARIDAVARQHLARTGEARAAFTTAATRSTAAGRWLRGSSPSSVPTPTRATSTCHSTRANGPTDRCSASAPTSSTTA